MGSFVAKLAPNGSTIWARGFGDGTASLGLGGEIVVAPTGEIYVTGIIGGDFTGNTSLSLIDLNLTAIGVEDALLLKLTANGDFIWARNFGGAGSLMNVVGLGLMPNGDLRMAGSIAGTATIPPLRRIGWEDLYVMRVSSNGSIVNAQSYGGAGTNVYTYGAAFDAQGNAYVIGGYYSAAFSDFGLPLTGGSTDFIAKIALDNTVTWARRSRGQFDFFGPRTVAVDSSGSAFVAGVAYSRDALAPSGFGNTTGYTKRYSPTGDQVWDEYYSGTNTGARIDQIALLGNDRVQVIGRFEGSNRTAGALTSPRLQAVRGPSMFMVRSAAIPAAQTPTSVVCITPSAGAISCSFAASVLPQGATLQGYVLRCRDDSGGVFQQTSSDTTIMLTRLESSRAYECSVASLSLGGESESSIAQRVAPQKRPLATRNEIDSNGDGIAEIVLRGVPMQSGVWNGEKFVFNPMTANDVAWSVLGMGDVAGQNRSCRVMRNANDDVRIDVPRASTASPNEVFDSVALRQAGADWTLVAVADLDGDGKADLVWRYTKAGTPDSGVVFAWYMGDGMPSSRATSADSIRVNEIKRRGGAPLDWTLLGVADVDADGKADLIWQSPRGEVRLLVSASGRTWSNQLVSTLPAGYSVLKVADFNGDGKADILLRNNAGAVKIWLLEGARILIDADMPVVEASASFFAASDFDGNGVADIVWKRADDSLLLWLMNSSVLNTPTIKPNAGVAPKDATPL